VEVVGYEADEARISHFYKWERFKHDFLGTLDGLRTNIQG